MIKKILAFIVLLIILIQPTQLYHYGGAQTTLNNNIYISMKKTYNYWDDLKPTTSASYELSTNAYWSNNSIELKGTERIELKLTNLDMEFPLKSDSKFKFAWKFTSTQYDYIGFIVYTNTHTYWIVSYFEHTIFGNGTNQGIYEFKNEQPNTWYEHEVNIGQLYLQSYGSLPQKITSINLINAYFGSTGVVSSNQVSYFDDFMFYSDNSSFNSIPTYSVNGNTSLIENPNFWIIGGLMVIGVVALLITYKSKANQKVLREQRQDLNLNPSKNSKNYSQNMASVNFCVNCHTKIDSSDKYCGNCGAVVNTLK